MTRTTMVLPAILLLLAACQSPTHLGEGQITPLTMPLDLDPVLLYTSPTEEYVLAETNSEFVLMYDVDLQPLRPRSMRWRGFGLTADASSGLVVGNEEVALLRMPDFLRLWSVPKPRGTFTGAVGVAPLPDGSGFVIVSDDRTRPNVWIASTEQKKLGRSGSSGVAPHLRGFALDDRTGLLLIVDDQNRLEIFDVASMTAREVFELPCRETDYAVVARNGWAFVGTMDGTVIPIEISSRSAAEPIRLGPRGRVRISLSGPGDLLGVAYQDTSDRRPPYATKVQVYRLNGARQELVAEAFFEADGELRDVAMTAAGEALVIALEDRLLAWRYAK